MRSNHKKLGDYICEVNARNVDLKATNLLGININKFFMPSVANVVGDAVGSGRVGVGIEEIAQVADGEEGYGEVVIEIGHRVANAVCLRSLIGEEVIESLCILAQVVR